MGIYFRPGPPPAAESPPNRERHAAPEVDEELIRRRRIDCGIAFLASAAGSTYREQVDAVRDFGGTFGPNWWLTPSNDVKCWEGEALWNPAIELRRAIVKNIPGATPEDRVAAGKAFELTFRMLTAVDVEDMWKSYQAWGSNPENLANGVALPGNWATAEGNQFQALLYGRTIYTPQGVDMIRSRINSYFNAEDTSGDVYRVIPSKKAFVDWCLVLHEGKTDKASSRRIALDIAVTQPAFMQKVGVFRYSKFTAGRVQRFDPTAAMVVTRIDVLQGGSARIEMVANIFRLVIDDAQIRRQDSKEVLFAYGENVKIHFRMRSMQAYWQGETGSFFFNPIEAPSGWKASGSWTLRGDESNTADKIAFAFPEITPQPERVVYSVSLPWMQEIVDTCGLPVGMLAHFMSQTLQHFPNPFDLSWKDQLVRAELGPYA